MKILYLDDALDDLVWFHHYYTYVFSEGAKNALRQFDITEELLTANPFIGKVIGRNIRKLAIPKTPFSYINTSDSFCGL